MRIGILSDTHDDVDMAAAAIRILREKGAAFYIHCGDVGGEAVLDQLAGLPAAFVFGNNDWDRDHLARYAHNLGIACHNAFADLELDGKRVAVIHGDDARLRDRILGEQRHDYLFQGHTHVPSDERIGRIRAINPGALHRARRKTVATLETQTDRLSYFEVAGSGSAK